MQKIKFKYIYGPVPSWRLGRSLGVDLLSQEDKICNFNCIYCQLGKTPYYTDERKLYVPTKEIINEINKLPDNIEIDYITFSGRGEPTLAINLGEAIKAIKEIREEPVAVLTNAALINREDVRRDLGYADFVVAKLDVSSQELLEEINNPSSEIYFDNIVSGLKKFREEYSGLLGLQIMFIDKNKDYVNESIKLANEILPDEIQINTPLRPSKTKPLPKIEILKIKKLFKKECKNVKVVSVYDDRPYQKVAPIGDADTIKRRGKA
ncbi:MAG: radical SAM protein [Gammaproteobacteria bacterium]|jgi:wyosine [tRNA(Phe)-imidazoG37] synthetase (radical SAM superfamily)